jgi:hypothetical protein
LLGLAESARFEIFVTMDKGLEYEQNLAGRSIAILILRAKSNRLADLLPLPPDLLRTMKLTRGGEIHRISGGEPASWASAFGDLRIAWRGHPGSHANQQHAHRMIP